MNMNVWMMLLCTCSGLLWAVEQKGGTVIPSYIASGEGYSSSENDGEKCSICFLSFADGAAVEVLQCKHTFCKDCIDSWVDKMGFYQATCPFCRALINPVPFVNWYQNNSSWILLTVLSMVGYCCVFMQES